MASLLGAAIEVDQLGWDWRPIYNALNLMELRGVVRRGYFVSGLPGVQFASVEFVDTMRSTGAARRRYSAIGGYGYRSCVHL